MKSLNAVKPTLNRDDWKVHKNKAEKYKKIISSQRGNQSKNSFYIHKLIDYYRHHNNSRTPLLEGALPLLSNVSVIMINEWLGQKLLGVQTIDYKWWTPYVSFKNGERGLEGFVA